MEKQSTLHIFSFNLVPPKGRIITKKAAARARPQPFQFSPSKRKDYHALSQICSKMLMVSFNLVPPKGRIITQNLPGICLVQIRFQFSPSKRKDYHVRLPADIVRRHGFNLVPPKGRIITLPAT